MCFEDQKREMVSIGSSSTNASPNSMSSQKENHGSSAKNAQDFSPIRTECSKSTTMPALSQVGNNVGNSRVYYNGIHHYDEPPIRYVDESTSASSTMSSRNGAQRFISPPLTRYFYEKDDNEYDEEPTVISNPNYCSNFDYDSPPSISYSSSPPYRHFSTSPVVNGSRIQSPMFYTAPHSLPRVSLTSYRNHEYGHRPEQSNNYPNNLTTPNVVKPCSVGSGIKNK